MKHIITTSLSILLAGQLLAQSSSQSIITLDGIGNEDKTVIELKDDALYVDGKKVGISKPGATIKIIKKHSKDLSKLNDEDTDIELRLPNFNFNDQPIGNNNRAILGVTSKPATDNNGAEVVDVTPNSPAQKLGLKAGDIIKKIDQQVVTGPADLVEIIGSHKSGDEIKLTYEREGKELKSDIALQAREEENNMMNGEDFFKGFGDLFKSFKSFDADGNSGLRIFGNNIPQSDNPRIGAQVEDRADGEGVRVMSVTPGSAAEKAGIKSEDIIITFAGSAIKNIDDLTNTINNAKAKKDIVLDVKRNGKTQTLYIQMPQNLRKKEF
jgi:serine protease Do